MDDWFVTVLVSVRDMAKKSGMIALAEEMDAAILIAAMGEQGRERGLGLNDVRPAEYDLGEACEPARTRIVRRYH